MIDMDQELNPSITPYPDGPYYVNDVVRFSNRHGSIRTNPMVTLVLCRCGASANKPFCDGTHVKIGFSSAKQERTVEDRSDSYAGRDVTIHDNRAICSHSGFCTKGLSAVFRDGQDPWIDPEAAGRKEIVEQVLRCPSGALTYSGDHLDRDTSSRAASIFVAPDGPYLVAGGPELRNTVWNHGASRERFALCRCGGSGNKPFCDGSHRKIGFRDEKN